MRTTMSIAALGIALMLGGCISIQAPRAGSSASSPVPVHVTWGAEMRSGTFRARLDDQEVTDRFRIDYAGNRADAALALTPGAHRLTVSGKLWSTLLQSYRGRSASNTFSVSPPAGSFDFSLQPSALLLERGGSGHVTINVARTGTFSDTVKFSTTPPNGVSTDSPEVAAGQSSGTLSVTVGDSAAFTTSALPVSGQATIDSLASTRSENLTLTVARKAGAFVAASPDLQTVGQSRNSPDSHYSVTITTGQQVADPADYAATFRQNSQTLGAPIGFYLDPTSKLGGAGFCPASNIGVVLSGQANRLGLTSQYRLTFIDLANVPYAVHSWPVDGLKATYTFPPRVYFSPDCTLALIAGANTSGTTNNVLSIIDLLTGNQVGHSVDFNTDSFGASVSNANGQSVLQISADQQTYQFAP